MYKIQAECEVQLLEDLIAADKADGGIFAIMTNDVDTEWDMNDLLSKYQSQQSVERGFHFLKVPEFFADSFFVKKPERLDALLMIMAVTLGIYSGIEHPIRTKLKESGGTIPNQVGKEIKNPNFRHIIDAFDAQFKVKQSNGSMMLFALNDASMEIAEKPFPC